jgi:antirestriction protein
MDDCVAKGGHLKVTYSCMSKQSNCPNSMIEQSNCHNFLVKCLACDVISYMHSRLLVCDRLVEISIVAF